MHRLDISNSDEEMECNLARKLERQSTVQVAIKYNKFLSIVAIESEKSITKVKKIGIQYD